MDDYEQASEVARLLVGAYLTPNIDLRRHVVEVVQGSSPLACVNLIEILATALGESFGTLEEFSTHVTAALARDM